MSILPQYSSIKRQLTHGSLFAGIGGFDLGFERAGIDTVWQVEKDERCREHLKRRFPRATLFSEIKSLQSVPYADVVSGGFPCQPFSTAGRRQARGDDRYLWPEMLRIICAVRPRWVVAENVAGLAHEFDWILEDILADLENAYYETMPPLMVPACAFGAWHRRDRIWILAHSDKSCGSTEQKQQQEKWAQVVHGNAALHVHGISSRMDRRKSKWRVEHLGEAVVPQIAEWIARRILAYEEKTK